MGSCGVGADLLNDSGVTYVQSAGLVKQLCDTLQDVFSSRGVTVQLELHACHLAVALVLVLVGALLLLAKLRKQGKVYVLDFAVHKPHDR